MKTKIVKTSQILSLSIIALSLSLGCESNPGQGRTFTNGAKNGVKKSAKKKAGAQDVAPTKAAREETPFLVPEPEATGPESVPHSTPDPRIKQYAPEQWPGPSPQRDGVDFLAIQSEGWSRLFFQVDPRRGQATVGYHLDMGASKELSDSQPKATVVLTIRLHKSALIARSYLLKSLLAVTSVLDNEPRFGDVAFSSRQGNSLFYLTAVRGNITYIVRTDSPGVDGSVIATATDQVILKSSVMAKQLLSRPNIRSISAMNARNGQPNPLTIDSDKSAPKAEFMAFSCSPKTSASVVRNGDNYELYAAAAGSVTIKGYACSAKLQTATFSATIQVVAGDGLNLGQ
jgi:hypothetical protein